MAIRAPDGANKKFYVMIVVFLGLVLEILQSSHKLLQSSLEILQSPNKVLQMSHKIYNHHIKFVFPF